MVGSVEVGAGSLTPARVRELVEATERVAGTGFEQVSVSFVSPDRISALNERHRGKSGPTDVLSFPFDGRFPQGSGGEIVIGRDEPSPERLLVHGALHLAGFDDRTPEELAEMERLTDRILRSRNG